MVRIESFVMSATPSRAGSPVMSVAIETKSLPVSLHGVRRRFAGLAVVQELGEPVWERITFSGLWIVASVRSRQRRWIGAVGHTSTVTDKRSIIDFIH